MSIEEDITKANTVFSATLAAGDVAGLRNLYSDDPWFLVPHADAIKGIDAVLAAVQGLLDSGITGIALATSEVDHVGDTAIEAGEYVLSAGDAVADRGKYMVVWKNIDGMWRLHRDMINTSMPVPA